LGVWGPRPNPQTPIPNPQSPFSLNIILFYLKIKINKKFK